MREDERMYLELAVWLPTICTNLVPTTLCPYESARTIPPICLKLNILIQESFMLQWWLI